MSRRSLVTLVAILAFIVLAMALNPSHERHRQAIREAVNARDPIAGVLGFGALKSLTVEYRSWGIASYTTVDDRVISVGAFGFVHVIRENDAEK